MAGSPKETAESLKGEGAPPGLAQVLPADWQARTFCQLPQGIPVVWLERQDAERVKRRAPPLVSRPPMPPMGASSSRCGCGGHLQSPLLGQRVENQEWFAKNAKLKEALMSHNSWKHLEANNVLREARAWADSVSLRTSVMGSQELPSEASQADATSSASQRDAGLSSLYHSGSKLLRKTLPPSTAREVRPKLHDISRSSGSRSARLTGPNIAERHASPPFWYSCNRAVYGPPPNPPAE
ncbi:unnamed protein product [Effrenium voratum]|nr:unnamed protein product [Effrenium voratum]